MSAHGSLDPADARTVVVAGDGLRARFDPSRGAKIVSLHDGGREWLAQPDPGVPTPSAGTPFVDAEMAGWDECAPSIVACTVDGVDIPDHGELWDAAFEVAGATATWHGRSFVFSRTIRSAPGGLRLDYRASSLGGEVPFLWAAHPQFIAHAGTCVQLPSGVSTVVDVLSAAPRRLEWTEEISRIDSVSDRGCRKVYVAPDLSVASAALVHPDGARLDLTWSAAAPYLGIWFDSRAYSREPVIALEPSTGYFDSLAVAAAGGRVTTLRDGAPLEWWVDVRVSHSHTDV